MSAFKPKNNLVSIKLNTGGKKSWQTIGKEIRAGNRVVNRPRAVKVIRVKRLEAVKVRADSRAARKIKAASRVAASRAEANRAANRTGSISARRCEFVL